jgi:threonylcarbamoyladenosine tRNA methylthiotransferase MtaB
MTATTKSNNGKFRVVTLGCRTNQYESQAYQDQLRSLGYTPATGDELADVCIVNTCTITESADSTSRNQVRNLIKQNPGARVVVTGCYADRNPEALYQIEGVTHVVSNKEKETIIEKLFPEADFPEFAIKSFEAHTRAFVKVQDGCESYCSFCIIPYVRGRSRSRTIPDVIREIEELISNGYKEVVITGINVGDYDGNIIEGNPPIRLAELVRAADKISGIERIRLSSISPYEVDDDLIQAILSGKHTCHSMHLALQAGSNVVLKRMNRKYTRQQFLHTVEKIRSSSPDFTFTTDIIVGFPGETDADFEETLEVMSEVKFAKVHMFPYSERERTRAALYPDKVPQHVIKKRKQEVMRASEQIAFELREQYVGRTMKVLTESPDENRPGGIVGHTENFLNVWIQDNHLTPNQILNVKLLENTPEGLIGKLAD